MRCVDIPITIPDGDVIVLDKYLGKGLQADETELPEDAPGEWAATSGKSGSLS